MRARAVIGSILLLLSALLLACGEEQDGAKAGDIIKARVDSQFQKGGAEASVTLPTGRLLIHAEKPVESATDDETRTRVAVDAPSGSVLVPISWQYDPWSKGRLDGIVATVDTPSVDLVTDEEHYRLPPPELADERGESFYVVVDGEAEDRSLEIEFDGVTQTVNLATGKTDKDDAAALYDIDDSALRKKPCDGKTWFNSPTAAAEFSCDLAGPVLTPYAAGEWAPGGSVWLAVTVQTEMTTYDEIHLSGGVARYTAKDVKVKAEIDGREPAFKLPVEDGTESCPVAITAACEWGKHLIFEVPAEDGEQGPLDLEITYRLVLSAKYGDWKPAERVDLDAEESINLWDD